MSRKRYYATCATVKEKVFKQAVEEKPRFREEATNYIEYIPGIKSTEVFVTVLLVSSGDVSKITDNEIETFIVSQINKEL